MLFRTTVETFSKPVPGDRRTPAQRRLDGLGEACRRALGGGGATPTVHGQRPHLTAVVPLSALQAEPGALAARLGRSTVVPTETWQRLLCDAALRIAVVDERGEVIRCGPETRPVPAVVKQAVALRDDGCSFPQCGRPVEWTDTHHLRHRRQGGPNTVANLTMVCGFHHWLCHDGGWELARLADGSMLAEGPFGERLEGPSRQQWSAEALARLRHGQRRGRPDRLRPG